jgi:hypothetical protein
VDRKSFNFHVGVFERTLRVANALVELMLLRLSGLTHEWFRS